MRRLTRSDSPFRLPDFRKLWVGQTVSQFGDEITFLALPLTAALLLQASPAQMGLMAAAQHVPAVLFTLFVGAWVDRLRRRPLLIAADLVRALVLIGVALAGATGWLRIEHLYASAFLVGVCAVVFLGSYQAYVPSLVGKGRLIGANSALEASASVAQVAGPGVGGLLIQLASAPIALAVDAATFLFSAVSLALVRSPEAAPLPRAVGSSMWHEIGEGLRLVLQDPRLRALAGCTAVRNLFFRLILVVFVVYATRDLAIEPAQLGLIFSAAGPGALAGTLVAGRLARRLGPGPAIATGAVLGGLAALLVPAAGAAGSLTVPVLVVALLLVGFSVPIYSVNQITLRQTITPARLLGRMSGTMHFLVLSTTPLGALAGGALAELIGLQATLVVGALGICLAPVWVLTSPLRRAQSTTSEPIQEALAAT